MAEAEPIDRLWPREEPNRDEDPPAPPQNTPRLPTPRPQRTGILRNHNVEGDALGSLHPLLPPGPPLAAMLRLSSWRRHGRHEVERKGQLGRAAVEVAQSAGVVSEADVEVHDLVSARERASPQAVWTRTESGRLDRGGEGGSPEPVP